MTDQPASLATALAQLQAELPHIGKDKTARVVTKEKGTYTYDYANLASILDALKSLMGPLGLAFTSKPTTVFRDNGDREFVLAYKLLHAPSGESDAGEWPLPDPLRTTPQQVGSAITYARRYCLCAVTGVAPDDDDDGQAAATAGPATGRQPRAKPPQRAAAALPRNRDGSTSRSQVTDDELADTGQMTDAQQRDHNRLERDVKGTGPQGTERLTATPDDDPWQLPAPVRTPQAAQPTRGVIHQHFKRLGFDDAQPGDKEARIGAMSAIIGRRITSTNDLTAAEGIDVGKFLGRLPNGGRDALIERLTVMAGEDSA